VITELILYSWSAGETSATILDNLPEYGQNGKNRLQFDAVLSASPGSGRYIICVISAEVHWIEHFSRKKTFWRVAAANVYGLLAIISVFFICSTFVTALNQSVWNLATMRGWIGPEDTKYYRR